MSELTPEQSSLVGAVAELIEQREKNAREDSRTNGRVLRRFVLVKDVIVAIIFFASLLGAAAVMFQRLAEKPTTDQVRQTIEEKVAPVRSTVDKHKAKIEIIERDAKRSKEVQEVLLKQNAYQGVVLEHIATKKRDAPPAKPKELSDKETELMK